LVFLIAFLGCGASMWAQGALPAVKGHAHNDYVHPHPLFDALHEGFRSVEVDLQVTFGKLTVAHTPFGVFRNRKIQHLYLDRLREIIHANNGSVYGDGKVFYLVIEIKMRPKQAMPHLKQILASYQDIISTYRDSTKQQRPIDVIMIAHTPDDFGQHDSLRYAGCEMHGGQGHALFYPLVSIVAKDTSAAAFAVIKQQISSIHQQGQIVRAWGKNDDEATWDFLLKAGVDLVHTDRLSDFRKFYLKNAAAY